MRDDWCLAEREWLSLALLDKPPCDRTRVPCGPTRATAVDYGHMTIIPVRPCPAGAGQVITTQAIIATLLEFAVLPHYGAAGRDAAR